MDKKICPSCRDENIFLNNFCTQCGSKLISVNDYQARLCVLFGEPMGAVFLLRNGRTTIGHDSGNLIVLGDKLVSNKHAFIKCDDDGCYWIEDRISRNGVFVNGEKVKKEILLDGSIIKLGSTILQFEQNKNSKS